MSQHGEGVCAPPLPGVVTSTVCITEDVSPKASVERGGCWHTFSAARVRVFLQGRVMLLVPFCLCVLHVSRCDPIMYKTVERGNTETSEDSRARER